VRARKRGYGTIFLKSITRLLSDSRPVNRSLLFSAAMPFDMLRIHRRADAAILLKMKRIPPSYQSCT
jgi:superfamily II DNA/RNA helicase